MDGIIIINKEKGYTSHDIVHKVKKMLNEKVGHTGTLDPLAEGVLPILVGKGTLCSKYLINHDKTYIAKIQLGKMTDTADGEGKILKEENVLPNLIEKQRVETILKTFIGQQKQIPPKYSAIKINGKKLYEYARHGQEIQIEPRNIEIYDIKLLKIDISKCQIEFEVKCSKGTYIRTLCEDIAKKMGTVGYMFNLKRTSVGQFKIEDAVTIKELEENKEYINKNFINLEKIFERNEKIILENEKKLELFLNGVQLTEKKDNGVYRVYIKNEFIGTGTVKNNLLKRDVIIQN